MVKTVPTDIPDELTEPRTPEARPVVDLSDIGLVLADYVEADELNNLDKAAIRCIEKAAQSEEASSAVEACLESHQASVRAAQEAP